MNNFIELEKIQITERGKVSSSDKISFNINHITYVQDHNIKNIQASLIYFNSGNNWITVKGSREKITDKIIGANDEYNF